MRLGNALLAWAAGALCALALTPPARGEPNETRTLTPFQVSAARPPALVKAVAHTPDGQLWVAIDGGLRRFDGTRFAALGGGDQRDAIADDDVTALRTDHQGRLWVATRSHRLLRLSAGRLEPLPAGRPAGVINAIAFDGGGAAWMAVNGALFVLRGEQWSRPPAPAIGRIDQLWQARDGGVLVEASGGWGRARGDQVAVLSPPPGISPRDRARRAALLAEAAGTSIPPALAGQQVTDVLVDRRGRAFFGTVNGLFVADSRGVTALNVADGLPDAHVRALLQDTEGGVWVVTHGGGLARVSAPVVAAIGLRQGLAGNTPFAVSAARDGSVWAGSVGGLTRLRRDGLENVGRRPGYTPGRVRSVLAAGDGTVWLSHLSSTVLRYLPDEGRFEQHPLPGLAPDDDLTLLHEEPDGALLIGTTTGALFRRRAGAFTALAPSDPRCAPHGVGRGYRCPAAVNVAHPRRAGGVHLGTYGGRLLVLEGDRLSPGPSLTAAGDPQPVMALDEDDEGALWVGTPASLLVVRGGAVTAVPLTDGARPESVYQILPDGAGRLWLAAARGILRTTRRDLLALAAGRAAAAPIRYTTADGLTSDMTMGAFDRPAVRAADGRLWFVNVTGLTVVDPAALAPATPPTATIDELEAGTRKYHWPALPAPVTVPPADRDLLFRFSAAALDAPHRLTFRHRLDGVDARWVDTADRQSVRYVHLEPGRYTFRVSARRADGGDFGPEAVLAVRVSPRFHETRAAIVLAAVIAALLIWLALRLRARQITARFLAVTAERQRIGLDLHDTLAQVFSAVGFQVDAVEGALERGAPDVRERIGRVKQMLRHGRHAARAVISNLRADPSDGGAALPTTLEALAALYPGVKLGVTVTGTPYALGPTRDNEIVWIVEQAVSNAVEHGRAHHIGIELSYEPERFVAWVRDDGQGFATDGAATDTAGHFGMRGMRERAARAGGELIVESCPGAGTEIGMIVPRDRIARRTP